MKKILIAAAFVIAAFQATALTEITLPDLKDCAYGFPAGTLGVFSLGDDLKEAREKADVKYKKNDRDRGYEVVFNGDKCFFGASDSECKDNRINYIFLKHEAGGFTTISKARERTLSWVELLERKYGIKMKPSERVDDDLTLFMNFYYRELNFAVQIYGLLYDDGSFYIHMILHMFGK